MTNFTHINNESFTLIYSQNVIQLQFNQFFWKSFLTVSHEISGSNEVNPFISGLSTQ